MVGIFVGVNIFYIEKKHAVCQRDYKIQSFLSIRHVHGDLCKVLGIDSSTDPEGMSVSFISCKLPTFK